VWELNDLFNAQNVTVVGVLLAGIGAISKMLVSNINKQTEERKKEKEEDKKERIEMYAKLEKKNEQMYVEEKERHTKEELELKNNLNDLHKERKQERKEWLDGLNGIKNAVNDLGNNMQTRLGRVEEDVEEIKNIIK
jgi:hypothetical protein